MSAVSGPSGAPGSVERLYEHIVQAQAANPDATPEALVNEALRADANPDITDELIKNAASLKTELEELKHKVAGTPNAAIVDQIEKQLNTSELAKVAAARYGGQADAHAGQALDSGLGNEAGRRAELEAKLEQAMGRAGKALNADLETGKGVSPATLDEVKAAIQASQEHSEALAADNARLSHAPTGAPAPERLEAAQAEVGKLASQIQALEGKLKLPEAEQAQAGVTAETPAQLEALQQQYAEKVKESASLLLSQSSAQTAEANDALRDPGVAGVLLKEIEKLKGGKVDLALEAVLHKFTGNYENFVKHMANTERSGELKDALKTLDPALDQFIKTDEQAIRGQLAAAAEMKDPEDVAKAATAAIQGQAGTKAAGEVLGSHTPRPNPEIRAQVEKEAGHKLANEDGMYFLERLAGSKEKAVEWAISKQWHKQEGKIEEMLAWGRHVLASKVPGLGDNEFWTIGDLFKADAIRADMITAERGAKDKRYHDQNLSSYARVLASQWVMSAAQDPKSLNTEEFKSMYGERFEAVQRVSGKDWLNVGRNLYRGAVGQKAKNRLDPERKAQLDRHPAMRSAMEDLWRAEDDLDSMNAHMLREMRSLLRSGMPIDKLMVAIMLLLTMREERKFKKTVAETGAIEQVEKVNKDIRDKQQRAFAEKQSVDAGNAETMSGEELDEISRLQPIEPVDFGLSAKSHHIMTQELQASLQFFQQMLQTLSQVLKVWQDLVDSILQRWR